MNCGRPCYSKKTNAVCFVLVLIKKTKTNVIVSNLSNTNVLFNTFIEFSILFSFLKLYLVNFVIGPDYGGQHEFC